MKKLFLDASGKLSSKRVAGYIGLVVALIMTALAIGLDAGAEATAMVKIWLAFSGACLGIGVFEPIFKQNNGGQ